MRSLTKIGGGPDGFEVVKMRLKLIDGDDGGVGWRMGDISKTKGIKSVPLVLL